MVGKHIAAILVLFVGLASTAQAAGALTGDSISRWVSSMDELRPWGDKHSAVLKEEDFETKRPTVNPMQPPTDDELEAIRSPFSRAVAAARAAGLSGELSSIIGSYGFSLNEWGATGDRIVRAYMALQMQNTPDLRAQMDQSIAQLGTRSDISEEQKEAMIASLTRTVEMYEVLSVAPTADIDAVRARKSLLDESFSN